MHSKIRNRDYDFTPFEEHIAKLKLNEYLYIVFLRKLKYVDYMRFYLQDYRSLSKVPLSQIVERSN